MKSITKVALVWLAVARLWALLACAMSSGAVAGTAPVWVTAAVVAPKVSQHVFASSAVGAGELSRVLADAYATQTQRRFPVLYWLHGSGQRAHGHRDGFSGLRRRDRGRSHPALDPGVCQWLALWHVVQRRERIAAGGIDGGRRSASRCRRALPDPAGGAEQASG